MVRRTLRMALAAAAAWTVWALIGYWLLRTRQRHHVEAAWFILTALALAASAAYGGGRAPLEETRARGVDVWLLVAVAASLLLYLPAIVLGLLSDDYVLLARSVSDVLNPGAWEHFRPLPLLAWKLLYPIGGPSALHALNIVLHGVNAWLLWRFSLRLGHPASVALFVAVVFLFFPAAVEPVAWNSGIFDIATVFFGLLFLHGVAARGGLLRALSLMALVAAMLSKETAVVLPLIALALAWRIRFDPRTIAASIVLAASYALVRVVSGSVPVAAVVGVDRSLRYALKETLVRPFATLGAPWTTGELQLQSQALLLGVLPAAVVIAFIVRHCVRSGSLRSLSYVAWVALATAPLGGFMFVNDQLQGSRYLYLPLCGWSLFLGDLVNDAELRRVRIAGVLLLGSAVVLGTWGVRAHLEPWREAAALREHLLEEARRVLATTSCSSVAFENVPDVHDGAAQLFRNGFDEAVRDMGVRGHGTACRFVWTGVHFKKVGTSQR